MAPVTSLHVAVFLPTHEQPFSAQFLDTACVDILAMHDKTYLKSIEALLPPGVLALAPDVRISYVGVGAAGDTITLTTGLKAQLTHNFADAEVAPGKLDVITVPGPDPALTCELRRCCVPLAVERVAGEVKASKLTHTFFFFQTIGDPKALAWLKAQSENPGTDIISICTGIVVCGAAGILEGKRACGPRMMQEQLAKQFEAQNVKWVGDEWRWSHDGNFWSSGEFFVLFFHLAAWGLLYLLQALARWYRERGEDWTDFVCAIKVGSQTVTIALQLIAVKVGGSRLRWSRDVLLVQRWVIVRRGMMGM